MAREYLTVAERAARDAGRFIHQYFTKLRRSQIHTKQAGELVTDIDRAANRLIVRRLTRAFPRHGILSEEGLNRTTQTGETWLIDPLDGTTNYATHIPYFSVSIALMVNGNPRLGVIYAPETNECFIAQAGGGAWLNGKRIRVSGIATLRQSMVAIGYRNSRSAITGAVDLTRRLRFASHHLRHNGSVALDLAYVAAGRLDAVALTGTVNPWDVAAGTVIVREASGTVSELDGARFTLKSSTLLATNHQLHPALTKLLR